MAIKIYKSKTTISLANLQITLYLCVVVVVVAAVAAVARVKL